MKKTRVFRSFLAFILVLLLSLGMCLPFLTKTAKAAETTYKIRVFSGNCGSFTGNANGEVKEFTGLTYGSRFNFEQNGISKNSVKVTDDKYYVKGFRESGRDNNTVGLENLEDFSVTRDVDFVVAYGLEGSSAAYTANYVDESGETLLPSRTYYGNIGDKPVVAYLYVDGYFPQAHNLTKTLSANAEENNFTFIYRRTNAASSKAAETAETLSTTEADAATTQAASSTKQQAVQTTRVIQETTIIQRQPAASTTTVAAGTTAYAASTTAADGTTASTVSDSSTTEAAAATTAADLDEFPDGPDEVPDLVDLDDEDAPMAGLDDVTSNELDDASDADLTEEATSRSGLSTPAKVGIGVGSVAVIAAAAGALYYFLVCRSRKSGGDEDPDDDD